jgi:hypothetical protein
VLGVIFAIPILFITWMLALLFEGLQPSVVGFHVTINSSVGA